MRGKISYSKQSVIYIYDVEQQTTTMFDNTPLMRATAWHPDGVQLAYGVDIIYCLNTLTGEVAQVSSDDVHAAYPAWRPDGQALLYTVDGAGLQNQLCLHTLATQTKQYLALNLPALQADWHPNGQTIAFVGISNGRKHIFKLDLACLATNACAEAVQQLTTTENFNHAPAWSPDGAWIAFESYVEATESWAIMCMDEQGGNLKRLTAPEVNAHHPTWSPDKQWLAFEMENEAGPSALYAIGRDGQQLTLLQKESGLEPAWYHAPAQRLTAGVS